MTTIRATSKGRTVALTSWLGAGALGLGFSAALACSSGIAHADSTTRGSAAGNRDESTAGRSASPNVDHEKPAPQAARRGAGPRAMTGSAVANSTPALPASAVGRPIGTPGSTAIGRDIELPTVTTVSVKQADTVAMAPAPSATATVAEPSATAKWAAPSASSKLVSAAASSTPSLSVADARVIEPNSGASAMAFIVTLSSAATTKVTVRYATANGTASARSDYTSASGTLTFSPGVTSQTVTVKVSGDTTVESDETFTVTLSKSVGATLGRASATGTIVNDDVRAPTLPSMSVANASVTEGDSGTSTMAFTVTLSKASTSTVSAGYTTSSGTATSGLDFNSASGTVTFAPGVTSQLINVGIVGDAAVESDETFTVALSAPSGAVLTRATATGTILNNDSASQPTGPAVPFGSHMKAYAPGTILPAVAPATMDAAVVSFYTKWKANFLVSAGSYGLAVRTNADYPYVAEAQGYGMELTALMAGADPSAQASFDGILKYVLAHPSSINPALHAAEQNASFVSVNGGDSATDGDMSIAYALLLADKQWGSAGTYNYKQLAVSRINAIKVSEMNPVTKLPTLGDWNTAGDSLYNSTRPSDFMIDHFRAFKAATSDPFWDGAVTAAQNLLTQQQNTYAPATGLVADFVVNTNTTPKPAPSNFLEGSTDGQYSYNSVRVPWHLGTDAAVYGDTTSKAQSQKMTAWFRTKTGDDPSKVVSGYKLDGTAVVSYLDPEFVATLGPAAMGNAANQAWLDKIWNFTVAKAQGSAANNYYSASLMLQAMIVMSGNYWAP